MDMTMPRKLNSMNTPRFEIVAALKAWRQTNPLYAWRTGHGLTRSDVSSMVGVSLTSLQYWECGNFTPGEDNMNLIARLTEIGNIRDLWAEWEDMRPTR